jgi:hypothetical protein
MTKIEKISDCPSIFAIELEGASINSAKISGTYFPPSLSAEEITLSLVHGTRLRYR